MAKTKSKTNATRQYFSNLYQVANVRTVDSSLMNKIEVFRMLALAEATGLPVLFIGDPGVAKTRSVLDFARSWMLAGVNQSDPVAITQAAVDMMSKVFIIETDEDTPAAEIKGRVNMAKLAALNVYELNVPISKAEVIFVNEVEKSSGNFRNSLLGVMNEKLIFNGTEIIPCSWKLFIAAANEVPKSESKKPFWDRFILKMNVERLTEGELIDYFKLGGRKYREQSQVPIPSLQEMEAIQIPLEKMEKFIEKAYQFCSDRTLTFVPMVCQAVAIIWGISVNEALVKVCSMMVNETVAESLKDELLSPAMKDLLAKVNMLWTIKNLVKFQEKIKEIGEIIQQNASVGSIRKEDLAEVEIMIKKAVEKFNSNSAQQFAHVANTATAE